MERMTHERVNGIKSGYWSAATKETLVQRLAAYENIGLMPGEIEEQLMNFSSFLCEMTGNRMSKTNYTVHDMVSVAEDYWQSFCDDCREEAKQIRERVRAYEETGLTPEEIKDIIAVGGSDLAKMLRALIDNGETEHMRNILTAEAEGRLVVLPEDGMLYHPEEAGGERWIGNKPIKDIVFECGWGFATLRWSLQDIGKTVFLTREEAEAKLKGESNG